MIISSLSTDPLQLHDCRGEQAYYHDPSKGAVANQAEESEVNK
jgi:hypothetical protein